MSDNNEVGARAESDAERRTLLKEAEGLWDDLQRDELGGYSGINRPFYIAETFKRLLAEHIATIAAQAGEIGRLTTIIEHQQTSICEVNPLRQQLHDARAELARLRAPSADPHPWYGPCDALGPGGRCAECLKVERAGVARVLDKHLGGPPLVTSAPSADEDAPTGIDALDNPPEPSPALTKLLTDPSPWSTDEDAMAKARGKATALYTEYVTHWRPLPDPPASRGERGRG